MSGTLQLYVCDTMMPDSDGKPIAVRHVNAHAQYETEAECKSAINDILERYAVGRECLFRTRIDPQSETDFASNLTYWSASVRFTALPRRGPWRNPPSDDASVIRYGLV